MVIPIRRQPQRGVVLLLALIALLLISAVGAAILFMTAAESSLVRYQRSSTRVFYATVAGLEEGRARLASNDPSFLGNWQSGQIDFPAAVGHVLYILNPAPGEAIAPWVPADSYYDSEYALEWGVNIETIPACITPPITTPPTVPPPPPIPAPCGFSVMSDVAAGGALGALVPQIPYKWVRITVLTERAANRDIDGDGDLDDDIPVFYDGQRENLAGNGQAVYRVTARAVLPTGAGRMAQVDVVRLPGGYEYALSAGNACQVQTAAAFTINGNIRCNSEVIIDGTLALVNGDIESYDVINGGGTINLDGDHQARANGEITPTVNGGGSPNTVSAAGTVEQLLTPPLPTPPPLPADTMPNPDATDIVAAVTQVNPPGICMGGVLIFDLGNTDPPTVFEFDLNAPANPNWGACGAGGIPNNFPATVVFQGRGTIYFSQNHSVDFQNNFGLGPGNEIELNIIARPKDNSVGQDTISFFGTNVHIRGLIYSHGEIYTKCPQQNFHVLGSVISYKDPNQLGPTDNGDFGVGNCTTDLLLQYDPVQLQANMPPGFDLLLFNPGAGRVALLNWREITPTN
ncbi:MAG: hypothetical protein ACE5HL_12005 [Terriglobia bacterium]